jgi:hypothetical protein
MTNGNESTRNEERLGRVQSLVALSGCWICWQSTMMA